MKLRLQGETKKTRKKLSRA
jgi:hypothetical protein